MQILDSATADQTLSTLLFAKQFGGREVISTLRMLSTFLREEIKVREEIDTRFGWVRNSAVLVAVKMQYVALLGFLQPCNINPVRSLSVVQGLWLSVIVRYLTTRALSCVSVDDTCLHSVYGLELV